MSVVQFRPWAPFCVDAPIGAQNSPGESFETENPPEGACPRSSRDQTLRGRVLKRKIPRRERTRAPHAIKVSGGDLIWRIPRRERASSPHERKIPRGLAAPARFAAPGAGASHTCRLRAARIDAVSPLSMRDVRSAVGRERPTTGDGCRGKSCFDSAARHEGRFRTSPTRSYAGGRYGYGRSTGEPVMTAIRFILYINSALFVVYRSQAMSKSGRIQPGCT